MGIVLIYKNPDAGVAQLVEHVIRNDGVVGSSPITGTRTQFKPLFSNDLLSCQSWEATR